MKLISKMSMSYNRTLNTPVYALPREASFLEDLVFLETIGSNDFFTPIENNYYLLWLLILLLLLLRDDNCMLLAHRP